MVLGVTPPPKAGQQQRRNRASDPEEDREDPENARRAANTEPPPKYHRREADHPSGKDEWQGQTPAELRSEASERLVNGGADSLAGDPSEQLLEDRTDQHCGVDA